MVAPVYSESEDDIDEGEGGEEEAWKGAMDMDEEFFYWMYEQEQRQQPSSPRAAAGGGGGVKRDLGAI